MKNVFDSKRINNNLRDKNFKSIAGVLYIVLIFSLFTLVLTGCKAQIKEDANIMYYYSFTDSLNNKVNLKDKPQRVVSLVGSYAETWILAGGNLIGVTNDVISERKMDLPSETKIVGTIKEPNLEEIIALSPDFVLLSPDIESHVRISETLKK